MGERREGAGLTRWLGCARAERETGLEGFLPRDKGMYVPIRCTNKIYLIWIPTYTEI